TFYAHPDGIEASPSHHVLIVSTGQTYSHGSRDHLELTFDAGEDRLGITLGEPIADDLSNALEPGAPAQAIVRILRRWRYWADRLVLPFFSSSRDEMEASLRTAQDTIFEI